MNRKRLICKAQKRTKKKGWACPSAQKHTSEVKQTSLWRRGKRREEQFPGLGLMASYKVPSSLEIGWEIGQERGSTMRQKLSFRSLLQREEMFGWDLESRAPVCE